MANPTTNFGWVMPTSTSLVTNLPADFNTFGQAVDTSMSELLGGTTGQVLSKTSNTNMDFTWVTPTDQTPLTTKGDLFTFSTVDARLAVGTNGQTLVADSSTSTGLKWATASGGGKVLQVVTGSTATGAGNSTSTFADTGLTATITPTSATSKILILVSLSTRKNPSNTQSSMMLKLLRGASAICTSSDLHYTNSSAYSGALSALNFMDSPSTTSATTYKLQFANSQNAASVDILYGGAGDGYGSIQLLEIGA